MDKYAIVYMVAGVSSRFNGKIKQLTKVGSKGETLIECSINQALEAGFNEVVFIVSEKTEKPFKDKFGYMLQSGEPVRYVLQTYDETVRDKPWGTADAICCIKDIVNCPFVICNGDDLYGEKTFELLRSHLEQSPDGATIGYPLQTVLSDKGGVNRAMYLIKDGYVEKITELYNITKTNCINPDDLCSMNIYALTPGTVKDLHINIKEYKKDSSVGRETEFLIGEELTKLIQDGKLKLKIYETDDKWMGITHPGDEILIQKRLKS